MKKSFYTLILLPLLISPLLAFAHVGLISSHSFSGGFWHPFSGIDHLIAMVSVGLLASQKKGWQQLGLPLTFLALMAIGGFIGLKGISLPYVELGISLSIIGLGFLVSMPALLPTLLLTLLLGLFAMCHGHAHGTEMVSLYSPLYYAGGFLLATALLHLGGFTLGAGLTRFSHRCLPLAGAGIALSTLWL